MVYEARRHCVFRYNSYCIITVKTWNMWRFTWHSTLNNFTWIVIMRGWCKKICVISWLAVISEGKMIVWISGTERFASLFGRKSVIVGFHCILFLKILIIARFDTVSDVLVAKKCDSHSSLDINGKVVWHYLHTASTSYVMIVLKLSFWVYFLRFIKKFNFGRFFN